MAIITPSSIVSEVRGSIGDVTYSRVRTGPVVKSKLTQTNPDSPGQQARRAAVTAGTAAYQSLSDQDFASWNNYVLNHPRKSRLGKLLRRSAYNEFVSRYVNRSLIESEVTNFQAEPSVRCFPVIDSVTFDTDQIQINWSSVSPADGCHLVVFASAPMSPGIRHINPSSVVVIAFAEITGTSGSINVFDEYVARFEPSSIDTGKRAVFAVKAVNSDNFCDSDKSYLPTVLPDIFEPAPGEFYALYNFGGMGTDPEVPGTISVWRDLKSTSNIDYGVLGANGVTVIQVNGDLDPPPVLDDGDYMGWKTSDTSQSDSQTVTGSNLYNNDVLNSFFFSQTTPAGLRFEGLPNGTYTIRAISLRTGIGSTRTTRFNFNGGSNIDVQSNTPDTNDVLTSFSEHIAQVTGLVISDGVLYIEIAPVTGGFAYINGLEIIQTA